jgi:hypothetical protein
VCISIHCCLCIKRSDTSRQGEKWASAGSTKNEREAFRSANRHERL